MDVLKTLGLGFVLDFQNRTSREVESARKQINGLSDDVRALTGNFDGQVQKMEKGFDRTRQAMKLSAGMAATGAAIMAPIGFAVREAIQDEKTWARFAATMIANGAAASAVNEQLAGFQAHVDSIGNNLVALPMADLDLSFRKLYARLGDATALEVFDDVAKMAEMTDANAAEATQAVTDMLGSFGTGWVGLNDAEKVARIIDGLTTTTHKYDLALGDLAGGLIHTSKNVRTMGMDFETTLALMAPLLVKGLPGRMAGGAVNDVLTGFVNFEANIKELRASSKKESLTLGDLLGLNTKESPIPADAMRLAAVRTTDALGQIRDPLLILKDVEVALGITEQRATEVREKIKAGLLAPEQALNALKLTATQQRFLRQMLGDSIGLWLGNADAIAKYRENLLVGDRTQDIWNQYVATGAHEYQLAKNNLNNMAEDIGKVLIPELTKALKHFNEFAQSIRAFAEEHPDAFKNMVKGVTGVGGALTVGGAVLGPVSLLANSVISYRLLQAQRAMQQAGRNAASELAKRVPLFGPSGQPLPPSLIPSPSAAAIPAAAAGAGNRFGAFAGRMIGTAAPKLLGGLFAAISPIGAPEVGAQTLSERGMFFGSMLTEHINKQLNEFWPTQLLPQQAMAATALSRDMFLEPRAADQVGSRLQSIDAGIQQLNKREDRVATVQQTFTGDIYVGVPEGASSAEVVAEFDRYVQDKADRGAKGQY